MTLEERMRLSFYQPQERLGGHDHIVLTRHVQTGTYYVKKELTDYNLEVYRCLQQMGSIFFPKIIEIIEDDGKLILVEEYIKGQNLEEYVQALGTLSEESVRILMLQVLEAVGILHAHRPPIIHRDIKPSNIVRGQDGSWKLVDFNTARFYDADARRDTTFLGTKSFAAPEQFGDLQTDARTDIYALGAMMNYLLTGKSHKKQLAEGEMGRIIERCTRFSPEDRYQSVLQLKYEIEALQIQKKSAWNRQTTEIEEEKVIKTEERHRGISRFLPPGFRTRTLWKMLLAAFSYFMLFYSVAGMQVKPISRETFAPWMVMVTRASYLLMWLLLIFFWFDYGGIHRHLPLMKKTSGKWRIAGYVLYTVVIAFGTVAAGLIITGDF